MLYQSPNFQAPILFAQRPEQSSNHRNTWELLGGKLEQVPRFPNTEALQWESPSERARQEITQEATLAPHAFGLLDVPASEHLYVLDDPMSKFNGYLIWTIMQSFALYHPDSSLQIQTPEHQNYVWLTAEEALDAYQSGRFDLHPQARFMLPKLVRAARCPNWR